MAGNALTASLLIHHAGLPEAVWHYAENVGLFRIERDPGPAREQRIKDVGTTTERAGGASGNLQGSLFLGLVILAIWQAAQGNVMAPAVTLLWYAFRTLQAGDTRHL